MFLLLQVPSVNHRYFKIPKPVIEAEITTGDQGTGKDDITKFLRALIFSTLLEIPQFL
jgi:hypothetical protein